MCTKSGQYLPVVAGILALFAFNMASADTLTGAGGGWQPASSWTQSQLVDGTHATPGTPYWNNASGDGFQGNIGWCLTGGSATCTMLGSPNATAAFFGTGGGGSVQSMFFTSAGAPLALTLAGIHTDETTADYFDVFGYYLTNASGTPIGGSLHPIFSTQPGGPQSSVGSTALLSLTSGTTYGFYIENVKGRDKGMEADYFFYMDTPSNVELSLGPDNSQHFAIFQASSGYIIGDEDGVGCTNNPACVLPTQFDFNNIIVTASTPVPEPRTAALILLSLPLAGCLLRRRRYTRGVTRSR